MIVYNMTHAISLYFTHTSHNSALLYLPLREVVTDLIEEYKAAERPDYVTWGGSSSVSGGVDRDRTRTSSNADIRMREELGDDL
jgi:hypothetical protein